MGNGISSSNITSHVAAPIANHDTASAVYFPPEIWRAIAALSTADSVVTLRQVSNDMRAAIDGLQQADLTQINQHIDSTLELYPSDDGVRSVTRNPQTQRAMARDANISPALQTFFAQSNNAGVRWALAGNPSLTDDARQERLAQDDNANVRWALAGNPRLTSEVAQRRLAQDDDPGVREALALNPSLTPRAREILEQQHV